MVVLLYTHKDKPEPFYYEDVYDTTIDSSLVDKTTWAFDSIVEFVIEREGRAYVRDISINEESRMGITKHTYKSYYGSVNNHSIINLQKNQAIAIYRHLFWNRNSLDSLVSRNYINTAVALMDSDVNLGSHRGNIILQRVIGMPYEKRTGRVDSLTLSYLDNCGISDNKLYKKMIRERRSFYSKLVSKDTVYAKYEKGWNNRLDHIEVFVETLK